MKFLSRLAALAVVSVASTSFVAAQTQHAGTNKQKVTTVARNGARSVGTREVEVLTKRAVAASAQTPKPLAVAGPASAMSQALVHPAARVGKGKARTSLLPGFPNATISSQDYGSTPVGQSSAVITLHFPFPPGGNYQLLSFASGLNGFAGQATCSSTECTAPLNFTPVYPGLTTNAVLVKDQNGNVIYETLISGTGTAPQFGFDLGDVTFHTGVTNQPDSILVGPDGNLYLTDASQNAVYQIASDFSSQSKLTIAGLGAPGGIGVDGAGTLYIADKTNNVIVAYNVPNATQSTLTTSQLSNPNGVAVDATGAVYVADTGNGRIIKIDNLGNETSVATGINAPTSLALDGAGDVFYVDGANGGEVTELPAQGGSPVAIGMQLGTLYDIAVDAAGRIYTGTSGGLTLISPDGSIAQYGGGTNYGIAVDPAGDVITTQPGNGSVGVTNRSISNFILTTPVDTTTTGGDTISNTGNTPLTLSNIAISGTVFTIDPSSQCVAGSTVQPGQTCGFTVDFTPTAVQSYQESYTATSNSLNVTTTSDVDTLYGNGTGAPSTTALAISPSATVALGQPVVLTATVTAQTDPPTPTGTVTFYNGSTVLGTGTLNAAGAAGVATYTTSPTAFPVGAYSITAVYSGDSVYAASTSSAQTLTVVSGGLTFVPATLSFGNQMVGTTGAPQTITVTNTGVSTVTISEDGNSDPTDFGLTQTCGGPLTGGSSCTVTVTFHPMSAGAHSQNISFTDDASGSPQTVVTSGTGVAPLTTTTLTATPATVAYEAPVKLTANVYVQDNLTSGQVIFCDTTAAFCNATFNLGVAQLTGYGTAVLSVGSGTIGTHSYTATYLGGNGYAPSTSSAQTVTVTGTYPTTTAIAATPTGGGNYGLTGTVVGFGTSAAQPRGSLPFLDASNGNATVATGILGFATLGFAESPSATSPYTVGSGPYGQAAGDFNGDGFLDLVVQNYESNTVSVLLGNGDGTFQAQVTYPVGVLPERVLVADLNGDGFLDLVVANTGSNSVSVLLGNGDGTFQTQATYQCGSPVGLGVMDINHDGYPDVVAGDYYDNSITVLLGNGDGTLQTGVTYATGGTPQTVAEGDFNGDGNIDVVVGNESGATVGVFLGNGDGTFQTMVTYPVGNSPQGVQAGDFNGDGKQDLAVSNSGDGTVGVLLGNGDGTFQTQVTYPVGTGPVGLVVADFNGDGYQDISVGNTGSNTQSVLLGNGDGTFQTQLTFPTGGDPYADTIGDFNGDGLPDISVSNFNDGTITLFLSQVTQTATAAASVTFSGTATHNVEASFPGDGNFSASVSPPTPLMGGGTTTAASTTTLTSTPAAPVVGQNVTFSVSVAGATQTTPVPTGTVTLTNTAVTPNALLGTITLGSTGAGTLSTSTLAQGTYAVTATYSGDTNYAASTSSVDTFTVSQPAATMTTLAVDSGGEPATAVTSGSVVTLTARVTAGGNSVAPGQVAFCDATAASCTDNHLLATVELVAGDSTSTATYKFIPGIGSYSYKAVFLGTATYAGSASAASALAVTGKYATTTALASTGVQGSYVLTATLDGFGLGSPSGNVVFTDTSTNGMLGTVPVTGVVRGFVSGGSITVGSSPNQVVSADVNGDGKLDLVVANQNGAMVTVLIGNGDGTYTALPSFGNNNGGVGIAVGDFNGDGKLDIATANGSSVGIFLGNGDGTFGAEQDFANTGSAKGVSAADLNGDGKLDLVVTDNNSGISIMIGNGDGTFTQPNPALATGGGPNFQLAVTDFNGDGKLDIAFGNKYDNTLSLLLGNGDGTFQPQTVIAAGSAPKGCFAGDFNGDGHQDIILTNGSGASISVLLGNGDGTFQAEQTFAVGPNPWGAAVGDLNGDGKLDVAVANQDDGTVSVLFGNGDGTFQPQQVVASSGAEAVAIGDTNGDGSPDIVVPNSGSNTAAVFLNQATVALSLTGVTLTGTGSDNVLATYSGDTAFSGSTSNTLTLPSNTVGPTTTTLAITPAAPTVGESVTFSVAVAGVNETSPVPTGTVTLMNTAVTPATVLGTITLGAAGTGMLSTTALPQGTYRVDAVYSGDSRYLASTSTVQPLTISLNTQTITFPAIPNHSVGDPPFTLSATASSGLAVNYAVTAGPATVAGSTVTLTGAGTVTIQAAQAGNATYAAATPVSQTFTVSAVPPPTAASVSPAGVVAGSAATTITLTGANFTTTDVVEINSAALTTTFVNATTLTAVLPATYLGAAGTLQLSVVDTATKESSGLLNFVVAVAPVVVFTGPSTASSDQQPMLTFQLKQPYAVPIDCVLTLTFVPATSTGIDDPAVQFSTGGRTINFTVPAGSTTTPPVQFQTGTVAGTVTVTLGIVANDVNVTPANVAPIVVVLPEVVPQVASAIVSRSGAGTSSTLTVVMTGFSNTREVKSAVFHFTPTPGNTLTAPDFTVDVTDIFSTWFGMDASDAYGSSFTYTQSFNLNADPSTIQSVTVTLVNGVGSSAAQTSE